MMITLSISSAAITPISSDFVKSASVGYFSKSEFDAVNQEMNEISSQIRQIERTNATLSRKSEYDELYDKFDELHQELDSMGAVLDNEMLAQLPAPSSINISPASWPSEGDCDPLTGSLADLAEYYENWFEFCGYEAPYSIGNEDYTTFIVHVRDISGNGGLLTSAYNETDIMTDQECANADDFSEIASTFFQYAATGISTALELSNFGSWIMSQMFYGLVAAIDSGSIIIDTSMRTNYSLDVDLITQLIYVYLWDEENDEWIYCLSSSDVYINETHSFTYREYVGGSGSGYEQKHVSNTRNGTIPYSGIDEDKLPQLAVGLYVSNNNSIPTYSTSYQIDKLELKRRWGNSGNLKKVAEYYAVTCDRPGDLWTLGG